MIADSASGRDTFESSRAAWAGCLSPSSRQLSKSFSPGRMPRHLNIDVLSRHKPGQPDHIARQLMTSRLAMSRTNTSDPSPMVEACSHQLDRFGNAHEIRRM